MPTGLDQRGIYNKALDGLSQSRVLTADEVTNSSSSEARWFNRNYSSTIRALLRANIWTFAKDLQSLTRDATSPAFDYANRYELPSTWVRLLPLTVGGYIGGDLIHYEMVGRFIHTDEGGPIKARGIQDMQNPDDWDDLFVDVAVARLMQKYALKLTGKTNYKKIADEEFAQAFETAEMVGAVEEYQEPIEAHDILRVRDDDAFSMGW